MSIKPLNHLSILSVSFGRFVAFWSFVIVLSGCETSNFMTGGATDSSYIAGYDLAIAREVKGLPPPSQEPTDWPAYWCQILRSIDSPPPSAQKKRLKHYLRDKRWSYGLAELDCR